MTTRALLGHIPASTARCGDCGEPLELVWLLRSHRPDNGAPYVALCAKCANARQPACRWAELFYCGGCGRGLRRPVGLRPRKHDGCCPECQRAVRAAAMRAARKRAVRVCEQDGCSETLVPMRAGHRYHSKRCADAAGEARRKVTSKLRAATTPAPAATAPPMPGAATICRCGGFPDEPEDDGSVRCVKCGLYQAPPNLSQLAESCLRARQLERTRRALLDVRESGLAA
jgi:hypothetical protein